ncbi:MAG TPA: type II toxin-antitoxin system PemK/MazF family toxin [Pirellulales bacterium]|nr:type II toxin-antitoxin system PemK/MazF family toxin [Pirellulales bacterium]
MERGQVFLLKPEADGKQRPTVVVSRDDQNRGHSVVVMPCYSQQLEKRSKLPYCVLLKAGEGGLDKDCVVKADEVSTLDKSRFDVGRGAIGRLKPARMAEILAALRYVVRDDR